MRLDRAQYKRYQFIEYYKKHFIDDLDEPVVFPISWHGGLSMSTPMLYFHPSTYMKWVSNKPKDELDEIRSLIQSYKDDLDSFNEREHYKNLPKQIHRLKWVIHLAEHLLEDITGDKKRRTKEKMDRLLERQRINPQPYYRKFDKKRF